MTQLLTKERIEKFDKIIEKGLCKGIGLPTGLMCIEAAITQILDEPFSDRPSCVTEEIVKFKIELNDRNWSSTQARARALRNLGIAQIGSKGVVDGQEFLNKLQIKIIQILIPDLFKKIFKDNKKVLTLVDICEKSPTIENCEILSSAAYDAYAEYAGSADYVDSTTTAAYADSASSATAAAYAAYATYADSATCAATNATNAYAAHAADSAAYAKYADSSATTADYVDSAATAAAANAAYGATAAFAAANAATADYYLIMCADLALEVLKELKSPGCEWL